tara:strand:- start:33 stop:512 length:480 start_codon:yes stop_codon:yes gene_type:complete
MMGSTLKTILLLEANPDDVYLIGRQLNKLDLEVSLLACNNKTDFINKLQTKPIDMVLSDNAVPGFDGVEALILTKSYNSKIPFIYVTGCMISITEEETILSLANAYTLKDYIDRLPLLIQSVWQNHLTKRKIEADCHQLNEVNLLLQIAENQLKTITWI